MKNFCIVCAATVLAATLVASASAGEHAVSKSTLNSMGFSSVQVMSDIDGLAVRGKGTHASVWGSGSAIFGNGNGGNASANGYNAGASHSYGGSSASGSNLSYAGNVNSYGPHGSFSVNFAGGGSSASAH